VWYDQIQQEGSESVSAVADWLDQEHDERIGKLDGMPARTLENVWWPFTQHGLVSTPAVLIGTVG